MDYIIVIVDKNLYFFLRMIFKLEFIVMLKDNGKEIYCIVSNILGERVVLDKIIFDVRCKYV